MTVDKKQNEHSLAEDIEALKRENALLRRQLEEIRNDGESEEIAQMGQQQELAKNTRRRFENFFEREVIEVMKQDIRRRFRTDTMPKYTLERMLDAEVFWYMLQKYPFMDGIPLVLSYQKILDNWLEEGFVSPWRKSNEERDVSDISTEERHWENVLKKHYSLSLGRLYELLKKSKHHDISSKYEKSFISYLEENGRDTILSERFYEILSYLMEGGFFSEKRHIGKINYRETRTIREKCMGKEGIFAIIF